MVGKTFTASLLHLSKIYIISITLLWFSDIEITLHHFQVKHWFCYHIK